MRKICGWYRLFIVFVILWTILFISISVSSCYVSSNWQIQINTTDKIQDIEIQKLMEKTMQLFEKAEKKEFSYLFLFCVWLIPIGFVYVAGRTTGWIIRGFRKDN